jgi:hypothetical protein
MKTLTTEVAGLLLISVLLVGFSACAAKGPAKGSVRHGDYFVEPLSPSAACSGDRHGSSGQLAQRIFYQDRLVTAVALLPTFSPHNPARLLYTVPPPCARDGTESGTFYSDGVREKPVQVNGLGMYDPPQGFDSFWSPDDKFVVVPSADGHMTLANLQTGQHSDYLSDLFWPKAVFSSHTDFRGWSPDGRKMAVMVSLLVYARRSVDVPRIGLGMDRPHNAEGQLRRHHAQRPWLEQR